MGQSFSRGQRAPLPIDVQPEAVQRFKKIFVAKKVLQIIFLRYDALSSGPTSNSRLSRAKKRRQQSAEEEEEDVDSVLSTPKKKKLRTTSRYIYETLFEQGLQSDVVVEAMGKEWKLHKVGKLDLFV